MDITCETDTTVSLERLVRIERDNALMLSYILDTNSIGNFRLPPGTTMNDVNYGAIDVADMISRLRRTEVVDLTKCMNESCTARTLERSESTRVAATRAVSATTASTATFSKNPFEERMTPSTNGVSASPASADVSQPVTTASTRSLTSFFALDDTPMRSPQTCELRLPDTYATLSVENIRELAFEIFATVACDDEQLETVRLALNIEQHRADVVVKYIKKCKGAISNEQLTAHLHLHTMLAAIENGSLGADEEFFKIRARAMSELLWSLQCSTQNSSTPHVRDDDEEGPDLSPANVLAEINRMLSLPDIDAAWVESLVEIIDAALENGKTNFRYPGVMGVKLYVELLSAIFDQVEDHTLAYDAPVILKSLEPVAKALGLADEAPRKTLLAFAIVRKAIAACQELGIECDGYDTSPVLFLLTKARNELRNVDKTMMPAVVSAMHALLQWGKFMMSDFMHTVQPPASHQDKSVMMIEPETFDVVVDIAHYAATLVGYESAPILTDMCRKSARAEYERARISAMDNDNLEHGDAVCTSLRHIAQITANSADLFSAHLERYISNSPGMSEEVTGCFAAQLRESFSIDLYAWLESGPPLTIQSLNTIWAVGDLQNALVATGGSSVEPMGLQSHTAPLVFVWLSDKIDGLNTIVERCISTEQWRVNKDSNSPAPSAVDFLRAVNETLTSFFNLRIPAHVSALRALTEGIDAAVRKFTSATIASLESTDDIIPPRPPKTRYKKDIVQKLRSEFKRARRSTTPLESSSIGAGVLRLQSLKFLLEKMSQLEKDIVPQWMEMQRNASLLEHPDATFEIVGKQWFEGLMAGAKQALHRAINVVSSQTAYCVIYRDMQSEFLDNIYYTGVHRSCDNITSDVLPFLDGVLGYVASRLDSQSRNVVAAALLEATVSGWMRVLLDGGPARVFTSSDIEPLEEEVEILSDFFIAGGQGLDAAMVAERVAPMTALLSIMSLSTNDLTKNYEEQATKEAAAAMTGAHAPSKPSSDPNADVFNSEVTLRVICHRADHAASKWIKARFSIGKTESSGGWFAF